MEKQLAYFRERTGIDVSLVLFVAYLGGLLFMLLKAGDWRAVLVFHVLAVMMYCVIKYGRDFLFILIAPVTPPLLFLDGIRLKSFLKGHKVNQRTETVVVLAHSDWRKLDGWLNPNFFTGEVRKLAALLGKAGRDFSFQVMATPEDVERVMADPAVREVYFYGHGSSHMFKLDTNNIIYYCDFADGKYAKEFAHQLHCGTEHGKSLIDYVVPEENRASCFLVRKPVTAIDIGKELDRRVLADAMGAPRHHADAPQRTPPNAGLSHA